MSKKIFKKCLTKATKCGIIRIQQGKEKSIGYPNRKKVKKALDKCRNLWYNTIIKGDDRTSERKYVFMSEKKVKITKAMKFTDSIHYLKGEPTEFGLTVDECVEALKWEMALLAKKNSSDSPKDEAEEAKKNGQRDLIYTYLQSLGESHTGVTCTEIARNIPALKDLNNQAIASLCGPLKKEGKVTSSIVKGKSLYRAIF